MTDQVSPERLETTATSGSAEALALVLEHHASERKVWSSWGQTLRAEATSLDGDIQSGVSFTREFLRSKALEKMFESVFTSTLDAEDKNNLLFIMKICLLNNRISSSSPTQRKSNGEKPAVSSHSDFVEQTCARLVKLGEAFIRTANARIDEWYSIRCTCDGSGDGTEEDENVMTMIEESLSNVIVQCREAVAVALGSIKVQLAAVDPYYNSTSAVAGILGSDTAGPHEAYQHQSSFAADGGVTAVGAAGGVLADSSTNYVLSSSMRPMCQPTLHEPTCKDCFDIRDLTGVFGGACSSHDDGVEPPKSTLTTTENTTTTMTGSSSGCMFSSPLPALEPLHIAEHDAWALHTYWRAVGKTREVSRELNSYIQSHGYDEEVRFRIEEQSTVTNELSPHLRMLFRQVDEYASKMEDGRSSIREKRDSAAAEVDSRIEEELVTQVKLRTRLDELEEEARQIRSYMDRSATSVAAHRHELVEIERRFAEDIRVLDRRTQDICRARHEVASHMHLTQLVSLFLNGLARKSAEQTAKHLKNQETVIVQQCQFAVDQSEDAIRRLGVVVAMLETSRSTLKEFCMSASSSAPARSPSTGDAEGLDGSQPSDTAIPLAGAPQSPPQVLRQYAAMVDDVTRTLSERVEYCRDVSRHIEDLFLRLDECGFETCSAALSPIRAMCDAVDFTAVALQSHVPGDSAVNGNSVLFGRSPSGMASRVHSSLELFETGTTSSVCTTMNALSSDPAVGGSAMKRKSGVPSALRKRAHRTPKAASGDAQLAAAGDTGASNSGGSIPDRVKTITTEVERLLQINAPTWRLHTVE